MFLTITTTHPPATDLGFLLHKHPERAQSFELSNGVAHVFYPEANDDRCTVALLAELDPVALVRGHKAGAGLAQYVNDRPYAAGSQFAVALRAVFGTALSGRCDARPELAATPIPLELHLPSVSAAGGAGHARRLFGPLDVIGDVHGCREELEELLGALGYHIERDAEGRATGARHAKGRTAVFVGDLVDRGPDTPGVLRLAIGMVRDGDALSVCGNHEQKLVRALRGRKVTVSRDSSLRINPVGFSCRWLGLG